MTDESQTDQEIIYEEAEEDSGEDMDLDMAREKIAKIKEKLKKCSKEKEEYLDGWQRAKAEMVNYRRRQEKQMGEWVKMAQAGLISELLSVVDTFESGIRNQESGSEIQGNGLSAVQKQLTDILKQHGLEEIKAIGEKFNPEFHEAIEQVELDKKEGVIVEEVQKGYMLDGKVIRAAKVKVTKKL